MIDKAINHAKRRYPNESCGFILNDGSYVGVRNYATEKENFLIGTGDYLKYSRQIEKIVHSHVSDDPENDKPSGADIQYQKASGVPWIVVVLNKDGDFIKSYEFNDQD